MAERLLISHDEVLAAIQVPSETHDIARRIGFSDRAARRALLRLKNEGLVLHGWVSALAFENIAGAVPAEFDRRTTEQKIAYHLAQLAILTGVVK